MRRISAKSAWWDKKGFFVLWYGFLVVWIVIGTICVINDIRALPGVIFGAAIAGLIPIVFVKLLHRPPLVDEVLLDGDTLVVRNGVQKDCIPIANVESVDFPNCWRGPYLLLTLRTPSDLGKSFAFRLPFCWSFFGLHPVAEELIRRVHKVRDY